MNMCVFLRTLINFYGTLYILAVPCPQLVLCKLLFHTLCGKFSPFLQFLPGEEHAVLLPEDPDPEVWQIRVCATAADAQHSL